MKQLTPKQREALMTDKRSFFDNDLPDDVLEIEMFIGDGDNELSHM